jgi:hypothetical protein
MDLPAAAEAHAGVYAHFAIVALNPTLPHPCPQTLYNVVFSLNVRVRHRRLIRAMPKNVSIRFAPNTYVFKCTKIIIAKLPAIKAPF